jgi:hypothetical protein
MLDELTTNRGELKVRTINSTEERNYQVNTIQLLFYFDGFEFNIFVLFIFSFIVEYLQVYPDEIDSHSERDTLQ